MHMPGKTYGFCRGSCVQCNMSRHNRARNEDVALDCPGIVGQIEPPSTAAAHRGGHAETFPLEKEEHQDLAAVG